MIERGTRDHEPLPLLLALESLTIGELVGVVGAQFRTSASAHAQAPNDRHITARSGRAHRRALAGICGPETAPGHGASVTRPLTSEIDCLSRRPPTLGPDVDVPNKRRSKRPRSAQSPIPEPANSRPCGKSAPETRMAFRLPYVLSKRSSIGQSNIPKFNIESIQPVQAHSQPRFPTLPVT
jgi:hypothetical protein